MTWDEFEMFVTAAVAPFENRFSWRWFNYIHPVALQDHWADHHKKETPIRLSYASWGDPDAPLLLCLGGIANTARRWDYLADNLCDQFHVVCLDWPGRGMSAWMPTQGDYTLATNVEAIRQLMVHLDHDTGCILGSSLGGSVAMEFCACYPGVIEKLILNDIGPFMPAERRRRRALAVARHYVFALPVDLFRRLGASAKNEGVITEDELLHNTYFQTKWSDAHRGRVYRHDPRALQAYAEGADGDIDQWAQWDTLDMPIFVIHGLMSDALLTDTLARMTRKRGITLMDVPKAGHTPALSDANQIHFVRGWLLGDDIGRHFSCVTPPATQHHLFVNGPAVTASAPHSCR
jgi:pimeloyl-ACP methyl ester carboxylesterase